MYYHSVLPELHDDSGHETLTDQSWQQRVDMWVMPYLFCHLPCFAASCHALLLPTLPCGLLDLPCWLCALPC